MAQDFWFSGISEGVTSCCLLRIAYADRTRGLNFISGRCMLNLAGELPELITGGAAAALCPALIKTFHKLTPCGYAVIGRMSSGNPYLRELNYYEQHNTSAIRHFIRLGR